MKQAKGCLVGVIVLCIMGYTWSHLYPSIQKWMINEGYRKGGKIGALDMSMASIVVYIVFIVIAWKIFGSICDSLGGDKDDKDKK